MSEIQTFNHSGGGELLRAKRKSLGLSIVEISNKIGVGQDYISNLERGQIRPTKEQLEVIYTFLAQL